MSESLRNCPTDWYNVCSNAPFSCKNCCAGMGSTQSLLRFSLNKKLHLNKIQASRFNKKNHPIYKTLREQKEARDTPEVNKTLSSQVKDGYATERKLASRLNKNLNKAIVKQTVRSGAAFGDGDLKISDLLQIDSKKRNSTRSFTVSWDEYQKGRAQGTNCWAITVTDENGKEHTLMCLAFEAFNNIVALGLEHDEHRHP